MKKFQPNRKKKKARIFYVFRGLIILLIGGLCSGGALLTYSWLASSPFLKVQKVEIDGLSHLREAQVFQILNGIKARSLLNINLNEYQKLLESHPWIKKASLKKHFPNQIEVQITEKNPVCFINRGQDFYWVDEEGFLISKESVPPQDLPEIKGIHFEKWVRGDEKEITLMRHGLEFIQMASHPNFLVSKLELTSIDLRSEDDLEAVIGGTSFLFRYPFSPEPWFYFLSVKEDIVSKKVTIDHIDLRFSGKVIVRPQREKI